MKKRIIKDFNNLPEQIREGIRHNYPHGYINHLITFFDKNKNLVSALPYETEEISYLIKMPATLNINDEDENSVDDINDLLDEDSFEGLDEEKYLIQEEDEESD